MSYKKGDTIRLRGVNNEYWSYYGGSGNNWSTQLQFSGLGDISGNIMSLIHGDDFTSNTSLPCKGCFQYLFDPWSIFDNLKYEQFSSAKKLILPSIELTDCCYANMFKDCDLKEAPEILPAEQMANYCYEDMFFDCENLTTVPPLPAMQLADDCYARMFAGCIKLTKIQDILPAEELKKGCYCQMFDGCDALSMAPKICAKTLAEQCCSFMFSSCASLKIKENSSEGHKIFTCPRIELGNEVSYMFSGCFHEQEGYFHGTPTEGNTYSWVE